MERGLPAAASGPPPQTNAGRRLSQHATRPEVRRLTLGLGAAGAVGAAAAAVAALASGYAAYTHYGPAAVWRRSVPWLWLSAALAIVGMYGLARLWTVGRLAVGVHERGLAVRRGRRLAWVGWEQILQVRTHAVRYGLPGLAWGRQVTLELGLLNGRRLRLPQSLSDLDGLTDAVKRNVYPPLLAEYTRRYNQGQALVFGPVRLTHQGLQVGRAAIAWSDVGTVALEEGLLRVTSRPSAAGRRLSVPAAGVPNVDLCAQFIQHLAQVR